MDLREIETARIDAAAHWYYRTKRIPLGALFERAAGATGTLNVVDIGSGSGVFSEYLADRFTRRVADLTQVDVEYDGDAMVQDRRISGVRCRRRALPARIEHSLVLLMDVLEHVGDDRAFLRSVAEACEGPNHVFITVPAFQALWSGHDVFLGHHRRYSLEALQELVSSAGIEISRAYYLFGLIFPYVWMVRQFALTAEPCCDLRPAPRWMNEALAAVGRVDAAIAPFNRLAGVTAVVEGVVAR